jgi:DNA repair exonuclease SbcCD ATPase subunit
MADKKVAFPPAKPAPAPASFQSPAPKPPGILLTPGTGTARRKRVSFGKDVKAGANHVTDDDSGATLFSNSKQQRTNKTKLQQALENSRSKSKKAEPVPDKKDEDVWEEVDDDADPEVTADVTVDLNLPQSQSGKYWKSCFESYHADAKAEMEKLVKYKSLAKSYAKMKDSEALDLQQKLQEERDRVAQMEKKVAELSNQIRTSREKGAEVGGEKDNEMMVELAKQTRLALDYREQVEELEDLLDKAGQEPGIKKRATKYVTSPRTQKTLMETRQELRRARAQVKELGELKDEVTQVKSELASEKSKTRKLVDENKKLAGDLSRSGAKVVDLEKQLDEFKTEARQKDRELRRLQKEHDALKEKAKARVSEATEVLQSKNETIAKLESELRRLKEEKKEMTQEIKLHEDRHDLRRRYSALANTKAYEVDGGTLTAKLNEYDLQRRNSAPRLSHDIHLDRESEYKENKAINDEAEKAVANSRALRHRVRTDIGASSSSSALSERENLQDTRKETAPAHHHHRRSHPSAKDTTEPSLPTLPYDKPLHDLRRRESKRAIRRSKTAEEVAVRPISADGDTDGIDLMRDRFARLGATTDMNTSMAWDISTSKANLPADRRAAAVARLLRKRAEKERRAGNNKENMPLATQATFG